MIAADLARPDWSCIHFTPTSPSQAELVAERIMPLRIDGAGAGNGSGLIAMLAEAFEFPDYFGGNWDAVNDCLRDLEWLPAENYALVVNGSGELWQTAPEAAGALIASWQLAAESWAGVGVGFHLIFEW